MRYSLFISEEFVSSIALGSNGAGGVVFENTAEGIAGFTEYLSERNGAVFSAILDSTDEEYHVERLPHLGSRDMKKAITNIVNALTQEASLWRRRVRSVEENESRTTEVAVTTIRESSGCSHWLAILHQQKTLLPDMCLMSDLCVEVLFRKAISASVVVVPVHEGNFRLYGICNHAPVIARKLVVSSESLSELLTEIEKTQQFIERSAGVEGSGLQRIYLGSATGTVRKELEENNIVVTSPDELVSGFTAAKNHGGGCIGFLTQSMLVRKVRQNNLLNGDFRESFDNRRTRHGLLAGIFSAVLFSAASGVAAVKFTDNLGSLTGQLENEMASLDERMVMHRLNAEVEESQIEAMRQTIQIGRRIDRLSEYTPVRFLNPLATELSRYPDIYIRAVEWRLQTNPVVDESVDTVVYHAFIRGYIEVSSEGVSKLARSFNGFIGGLENTSIIDAVEVEDSPLGQYSFDLSSDQQIRPIEKEFSIKVVLNELLED